VRNEQVEQRDPWKEIPLIDAKPGFDREVDLWLNKVGKVSTRWPIEEIQAGAEERRPK
jgi:hypothetical protein